MVLDASFTLSEVPDGVRNAGASPGRGIAAVGRAMKAGQPLEAEP